MEQFTIHRDDCPHISFTGELIAEAETSPETARSDYSGSTGRWQELKLYRTKGGKYICSRKDGSQWQGEHDRHEAAICDDHAGIVAFFGYDRLAMELYEAADIDASERIE